MRTLREIRNRIADLESEKTKLNAEIEELREKAETKAEVLEEEVSQLRKEAESLKELLDNC
ncbi:hypothetical protein AC477_03730 [miscellaneous Crenarchaeota group-1 archaeon SG8-32-1]|jgi:uncharacterized coiled-coil DUF342 family protein|uniref:Uncharacterized protein n=1 Tax=miscellaneous Crenarchaeota group-1 archaeon SG8-32-1 TaxID=1685124 RepID=A0A0M0BU39_9ARCH|nr:MAG: hypothetical protein AC477_03730 [miscellaneous Crenarchaeota group-1 archaeon SG8-32-1]